MSGANPIDGLPEPRMPGRRLRTRANRWYVAAALLAGLMLFCALPLAIYEPVEPARRRQCRNNLKQIGLALHNYHDKYGCLPPAYIADKDGRPMHSWRVLILPFLDQVALYEKYRFDEPWDGPNNRKLADTVLSVYNCPSNERSGKKTAATSTNYVAIVGPETAWPEQGTRSLPFEDGTSLTFLVVETANSGIHWMEPRDLHVLQMAPTINASSGQGISSRHAGGAQVLIADGSVRFVTEHLSSEQLRAWLTPNGGDKSQEF